jgi:hypothetical protein
VFRFSLLFIRNKDHFILVTVFSLVFRGLVICWRLSCESICTNFLSLAALFVPLLLIITPLVLELVILGFMGVLARVLENIFVEDTRLWLVVALVVSIVAISAFFVEITRLSVITCWLGVPAILGLLVVVIWLLLLLEVSPSTVFKVFI